MTATDPLMRIARSTGYACLRWDDRRKRWIAESGVRCYADTPDAAVNQLAAKLARTHT